MTLHDELRGEVGVRELHNHLSRYLQEVENGAEIGVTSRGRLVARLIPVNGPDPLGDLRARGLVREPTAPCRRGVPVRVQATGSVSDLVSDQRG